MKDELRGSDRSESIQTKECTVPARHQSLDDPFADIRGDVLNLRSRHGARLTPGNARGAS